MSAEGATLDGRKSVSLHLGGEEEDRKASSSSVTLLLFSLDWGGGRERAERLINRLSLHLKRLLIRSLPHVEPKERAKHEKARVDAKILNVYVALSHTYSVFTRLPMYLKMHAACGHIRV